MPGPARRLRGVRRPAPRDRHPADPGRRGLDPRPRTVGGAARRPRPVAAGSGSRPVRGRRGGRRGARPGGRAAIRLRAVDVHRGGLGADGRRTRLPARPRPGARRRRGPGLDRHRVVGRRGRDRHPRARGVPPRPSRPRAGASAWSPPSSRACGTSAPPGSRCARRSTTSARSRPTARPGCTRSSTSGHWSVRPPRRPRRPATSRARAPAPRGGWTACRAAAPSGRAGRHRPPRRRGRR